MSMHRFLVPQARTLCASLLALQVLGFAACGGGSGSSEVGSSSSSGSERAGRGGKGGPAISAKTQAMWSDAVKAFKSYEPKDWNDAHCDEVASKFEAAASGQKKFPEALYMAGLSHGRCGRTDKAKDFYEKALRADSKFCKARVAIGLLTLNSGNESAAEREFSQSIADDPQCTEGYANLAILQRRQGLAGNKEALANLRRALAIDAQYLPAFNEMALLYLSEAEDNDKKLDLAEVVCSQAQKIDANYAPIYNTWGLIDLQRGKIIDAAAKFKKATELDDRIFEAHMNLARITIGFRGYQDAKDAYEAALKLQPNNFEAQLGLGVALRGLEQNDKAQEAYEKAAKLNPSRPEPFYNLGVLYQDFQGGTADDMKKARGYYEEFLAKAGGDKKFANAVDDIRRTCKQEGKRKRGKNQCVAGRLQNIQLYLDTMKQMAEMEALNKEAERQAAEMEAAEKAEAEKAAQQEQEQEQEQQQSEGGDKPEE